MAKVFLVYLGQKYKTLNILNKLGLSWKSAKNNILPVNQLSLFFDQSSQAESH